MIIIDYYNDTDLLKEAITAEEKRLKGLRNFSYEIEKTEEELRRLKKKNNKEEYEEKKRYIESLQEEQEKYYKEAHKLAIKNTVEERKFALSEYEKVVADKLDLEQRVHDKIDEYIKEEDAEKRKALKEEIDLEKQELKFAEKKQEFVGKRLDLSKKINAYNAVNDKRSIKELEREKQKLKIEEDKLELQRRLEAGDITEEDYKQAKKDIKNLELQTKNAEMFANLSDTIKKGLSDALNKGLNKINVAIQDVTSHRTKTMARLQNLSGEYDYSSLLDTVSKNLAVSPYVQTKQYMQKLDEAVDKGIAYNVEQRAFLATIKDDIATTFDAFDSNLMRIIRLQQADSTAARLGMEAALTKTLNSVFSDTSYLSDMYDAVTAAIVDSEATMSRSSATEFEYVVQKWMGALYSLGASQSLINQIAQGINYLGTGNVQALASNSPLQTLFAMSASRAEGLDYAKMLVEGLDASNTNKLLKSMVEYLKEIAIDNKNNNVVKAAYGDLYQMSLADMRAITSLTEGDISSIYSQNLSYDSMKSELERQFNAVSKRLSTGEMITNIIDNFIYSTGSEIAQNAVTYTMWQITDLIENATGGLHLPAVSVFGNMVDLSAFTIEGIMKTGIVGLATLGEIGNILGSIGNGGGLNLSSWGYQDTLSRGQIEEIKNGSITSTSGSTYVGSSSSSDIKKSSLSGAMDDSSDVAEITSSGHEDDYTINDFYVALYEKKEPIPIYIDDSFGVGKLLRELIEMLYRADRIQNVNIKGSDVKLSVSVSDIEYKLRESIKNYIKTNYVEILADEMKSTLIGNTRSSATIAKVCDKIMNDSVDVEIKNNGIDMILNRLGSFGMF